MNNRLLTQEHYSKYNQAYLSLGKGVVEGLCTVDPNEKLAFIGGKMNLNPNDKVLDAGSGFGYPAFYFASTFKVDLTGINLDKEQLYFTNNMPKGKNKIRFEECNFNNISSLNTKFDKVLFIETIGHSDSLKDTLREVYNNLNPEGLVFIQTTFSTGKNLDILKKQEEFFGYTNYMEEDFINECKNNGFAIKEISKFPNMKWNEKGVRSFMNYIKQEVHQDDKRALDFLDTLDSDKLGIYTSYWRYVILQKKFEFGKNI
jgi:SAM-dependent methyltransferase